MTTEIAVMKTDTEQIARCINEWEQLGDDISWSLTKITNQRHALTPGGGYGLTLRLSEKEVVWESGNSILEASDKALKRWKDLGFPHD